MKTCPFCAEEIQDAAIVCKHCGREVNAGAPTQPIAVAKPKRSAVKTLAAAFFVVIVFLIAVGSLMNSSAPSAGVGQPGAAAATNDPEVSVTAAELRALYDANEIAADARYKGRFVAITGLVDSVGTDIVGTPYIALRGNGGSTAVQAMFARTDSSRLAGVAPWSRVTVVCKVSGKMVWPIARECRIP